MDRVEIEEMILQQGIAALKKETGLVAYADRDTPNRHNNQWDGVLNIHPPGQGKEISFVLKIKRQMTQATIGAIAYRFSKAQENHPVLITQYVTPQLATELKDLGIQFIDTVGNTYLNVFPLFIYVKGNKKVTENNQRILAPRAFQPKGLKVVFALLCNPGLEKTPFRNIAKIADVALGTVNAVFQNLQATGNIIDKGRYGRELLHKNKLLDRWVVTYPDTLRPKITTGRYTAKNKYWWEQAKLPEHCYWGGEVAAAKVTRYLKPQNITIYTHQQEGKLIIQNRLKKDPDGEIEIIQTFWDNDTILDNTNTQAHDVVHPLLIYADLIATNDARNHETAQIIYDNELDKFIQ